MLCASMLRARGGRRHCKKSGGARRGQAREGMGWLVIGARDLRIALVCPNGERRPEASAARRCKRDNALPRHCGASEPRACLPACLRDDPGRVASLARAGRGMGRAGWVSGPGEVDLATLSSGPANSLFLVRGISLGHLS